MNTFDGCFGFFPVGQGLFYGGSVSSNRNNLLFTFVYDCGTEKQWSTYLNNSINTFASFPKVFFGNNTLIRSLDLIVVSHLHADHFSGIYNLIKTIGKPRKILLPLIEFNSFVREIVLYGIFSEKDDFADNQDAISFFLEQYSNAVVLSNGFEFDLEEPREHNEEIDSYVVVDEEISVPLNNCHTEEIWRFEFARGSIGYKSAGVINLIKGDIQSLLTKEGYLTITDYVEGKGRQAFDELQKIYKKHGFASNYSLNNTSTILLHYPVTHGKQALCLGLNNTYRLFKNFLTATLLTGDSRITKKQADILKDLIDDIEPCFLVTQLPHHGAKGNFQALTKHLWSYIINGVCVVSYGVGNSHGHPDKVVVHSFSMNQLVKVNEYRGCFYRILF